MASRRRWGSGCRVVLYSGRRTSRRKKAGPRTRPHAGPWLRRSGGASFVRQRMRASLCPPRGHDLGARVGRPGGDCSSSDGSGRWPRRFPISSRRRAVSAGHRVSRSVLGNERIPPTVDRARKACVSKVGEVASRVAGQRVDRLGDLAGKRSLRSSANQDRQRPQDALLRAVEVVRRCHEIAPVR